MDRKIYLFLVLVFTFLVLMGEAVAQQKFNFTVVKAGSGTGTVTSSPSGIKCGSDCTEAYTQGKTVSLNAKADPDSYFAGWSGGCSGTKACKVTMNADTAVTATFEQKIPDISLSTDSLDFGTVEVGKKATQILQIANPGTGDLQITISGLEGTIFSIQGKSDITIKSKKTYNLMVTCKPTSGAAGISGQTVTFEAAEELEEPDANELEGLDSALDAIILVTQKATMNITTNAPGTPLEVIPLTADATPSLKGRIVLKIDALWTLSAAGTDFTATESGAIQIKLVNNIINCDGQFQCVGTTNYSLSGNLANCDKKKDSGSNKYILTGRRNGNRLDVYISLSEFGLKYWEYCCHPTPPNSPPCYLGPLVPMNFPNLTDRVEPFPIHYEDRATLTIYPPKIPAGYGGKVTLTLDIYK